MRQKFSRFKIKYNLIFEHNVLILRLKPNLLIMKKILLSIFIVLIMLNCSELKSDKLIVKAQKNNSKTNSATPVYNDKEQIIYPVSNLNIVENTVSIQSDLEKERVTRLRELQECYLNESPFKDILKLSKSERRAIGLPPNKYYESEWEASINPETGRPTPENLHNLRSVLAKEREEALALGRSPGDAFDNSWIERGPTNVGGRTRAILFDPNDLTNETVFAGGVCGGLWKNTNISNANSTWLRVNIPDNLAVSCICADPNNSNLFYVGTGESYVGGDVNGDGVWKSSDAGATWVKVFGGITGPLVYSQALNLIVNSPLALAGGYGTVETTSFGVPITSNITNNLVLVNDGTAAPTEGCNAFTTTNAAAVSGKIALIRRGSCTFVQKVSNAKAAGAIAVVVMNNVPGTPIAMGGTDDLSVIDIPSVMISKEDGDLIVSSIASNTINVTLKPNGNGITGYILPGQQHINDIVVRNNSGVSEIFVAAADGIGYGAYLGGPDYGLFKSSNAGSTWSEVSLPLTANGLKHCPNDLEISAGNKLWLATTGGYVYGVGGGKVFSSTDGINFEQKFALTDGDRTQIAVSKTNANKVYVLTQIPGSISFVKTTDNFATTTNLPLPADADSGIPANDFTRGQAFYDLVIKADPINDDIVYTGGIDLFKSINGGASWSQFTHWYGGFGFQNVHADQHAIAFGNGTSAKMLFGNDGGVYYSANSGGTTLSRNKGFNVTQFYSLGVAPTNAVSTLVGDYFVAGAQDNGSQYFANAAATNAASVEVQGGDGAFSLFDQGADKYYITNYVYNQSVNLRFTNGTVRTISNESTSNGAFISPMVLDSNRDVLYSDYTTGSTYQIRRFINIKSGTVTGTTLSNALLTGQPTAFAVSKYTTTSTTMLVGTRNGKLLRVTNANVTPAWVDITGSGFVGTVSDVEFGSSNNEIFVTFSNYGVTSIWYSSDAGVSWQNKEGNFPDIPVKCILQNPLLPTTEVIIGTELGVWYTNNFNAVSPIWSQSYNGMRNVKVTDLDLRNDNVVFAATYGRGIFSAPFTNAVLKNESFINDNQISIFPNPVKDKLNIDIKNFEGAVSVRVLDINGKVVLAEKIEVVQNNYQLNLNFLPTGIYVLKLQGENLNYSNKIIKD